MQSSTDRQMGPILSIVQQRLIAPKRDTRPKVGRKPVTPQTRLGDKIEPSVSVPIEKPTSPAAVAAADPAEEPGGVFSGFPGFFVMPPNQSPPCATAPTGSLAAG